MWERYPFQQTTGHFPATARIRGIIRQGPHRNRAAKIQSWRNCLLGGENAPSLAWFGSSIEGRLSLRTWHPRKGLLFESRPLVHRRPRLPVGVKVTSGGRLGCWWRRAAAATDRQACSLALSSCCRAWSAVVSKPQVA